MENKDPQSWSSSHIYQSQWLQTTISELDEKLDAMRTVLDGDNSPNQEHMHCKWREDLMQMLEEFGQSYRVLAISHNQLKFKTSHDSGSSSSSGTSKTICAICNKRATDSLEVKKLREAWNHHPAYYSEHSDIKFVGSNLGFDLLNKQEDECHEVLSADPDSMKFKSEVECRDTQMEGRMTKFSTTENDFTKIEESELHQRIEDPSMINFKFDNRWLTLKYQITKLTEDNLHQLVLMVQRNDEKRETIRRLQLEVETLKRENKSLKISSRQSNADSECNESQMSRTGGRSMHKLLRSFSP